jgi:hypothetical protein
VVLFERFGKSRRRLVPNPGRNLGDGVVAGFEHQCGLVHPTRDEVTVHRLADQPSKASREGRAAEPHMAPQRAKCPRMLGVFVDQLQRLADGWLGATADRYSAAGSSQARLDPLSRPSPGGLSHQSFVLRRRSDCRPRGWSAALSGEG